MKRVLRIASLFTGCGGLDLGFEKAGHPEFQFKVVWANDNFSPAVETFKKNFGDIIVSRDVWKIDFNKTEKKPFELKTKSHKPLYQLRVFDENGNELNAKEEGFKEKFYNTDIANKFIEFYKLLHPKYEFKVESNEE